MTELTGDESTSLGSTVRRQHPQNIGRGAELIQQLSSFARDVPLMLRRKSVSAYLERARPLLQMHVQKRVNIEIDVRRDADVRLDANRLDQALANVMLNERDAMCGQGVIRLTVDHRAPEAEAGAGCRDVRSA
jgi:C4-dicarboxylate-specific signal transduction histidine kinase